MPYDTENVSLKDVNRASPSWLHGWLDYHFPKHGARRKGGERMRRTLSTPNMEQPSEVAAPGQGKHTKSGREDYQTSDLSEISLEGIPICHHQLSDSDSQPSTVDVAYCAVHRSLDEKALPSKSFLSPLRSLRRRISRNLPKNDSNTPSTPYHPTSQRRAWIGALNRPQLIPKCELLFGLFSRHSHHHHPVTRSERSSNKALAIRPRLQSQPSIPPGGDAARASVALYSHRHLELNTPKVGNDLFDDTESGIVVDLTKSFEDMAFMNIRMGKFTGFIEFLMEKLLTLPRS